MTYQGTRRPRYLIMASVAVLSLGICIGSGIGIGFGIFHKPNPCDSMKLSIVENSKVPANQTACVGLTNDGNFVKLTSNSEACNNACEAYHYNTARNTASSRSGQHSSKAPMSKTLFSKQKSLRQYNFMVT